MGGLYNNLNLLLLYCYLGIFLILLIKSIFFSLKLVPELFFIFFGINVCFISFRFLRILSNNISLTLFLKVSCFFGVIFLIVFFYLKLKRKKKQPLFSFFLFKTSIIKKVLLFLVEFNKIFDIFFLNKFKNLSFLEWIRFFNNYLREVLFEKIFLDFFIGFLILTTIFFILDFTSNKITYSLMLWFLFNILFRSFSAIFYLFHLYFKFALSLFLHQIKYLDILEETYFYSGEWRFLFRNWAHRDLEQVLKTSEFTYSNYLWTDYKRLDLFLGKLSIFKEKINVFFAFFFIFNFIKLFLINPIILLVWQDLYFFCLVVFFLKIFVFRVNFFNDNPTRAYVKFLFGYNWWLKNNKQGYCLYQVPPEPFFKTFFNRLLNKIT